MSTQIQSALEWRYATKLFNTDKKISETDLDQLLETVRLAPSSLGLQPWKVIVVTNTEVREKLKAAAWNQAQISEASHLVIFLARKTLDEAYVDSYLHEAMKTRNQTTEDVMDYKKMIMGSVASRTPEAIKEWNARQAYIALGFLLESAALMKIDACPMEGFDPLQFDTILGLDKADYGSVVIAAIGYRSNGDKYALAPKVRFAKKDIITLV